MNKRLSQIINELSLLGFKKEAKKIFKLAQTNDPCTGVKYKNFINELIWKWLYENGMSQQKFRVNLIQGCKSGEGWCFEINLKDFMQNILIYLECFINFYHHNGPECPPAISTTGCIGFQGKYDKASDEYIFYIYRTNKPGCKYLCCRCLELQA